MLNVRRFNRHKNMKEVTMTVIMNLTRNDLICENDELVNMLYGLFDGFDYTDDILKMAENLFENNIQRQLSDEYRLLTAICREVKKYPNIPTAVNI